MFFPDPVNAVREILRVLKPEKKLAFAVWSFPDNNPYHYVLARVVDRYIKSPTLTPDAPDAFRFADWGKLVGVLAQAGAADLAERLLRFPIAVPGSVEDFWALRYDMSDKFREQIRTQSAEQQGQLKREAIEAFQPYASSRGVSFPAEVLIVSGRKTGNHST
jgi:hypothetical protein